MIKRTFILALSGLASIGGIGCKNQQHGDYQTVNSVEYKIVKDVPGKNAAYGDIVEINMRAVLDTSKTGSMTLADTRKDGQTAKMMLDSTRLIKGDYKSALTMMSPGDSAVIRVSIDTLKKYLPAGQQLPPFMKPGHFITCYVSLVSAKSMEEYKKEEAAKEDGQKSVDDKKLQDYFAQKNIHAQKTASGLYYVITKEGSGDPIKMGENVSIKYTGKTLDGKIFDSNVDSVAGRPKHTELLKFPVGMRQMIPGMDEGIMLLKKGTKATLYLPSGLAYGERSPSPDMGSNAILVFDVEVVDVKPAAAPGGNATMGQEPPQQ